ncbi:hypothetical protein Xoosp13_141 [Xanthomonas phage Xoo-sp13]|nr:hypothetical protein Xoosp13_141 [Xanthomonas phage Xoo-sp13]
MNLASSINGDINHDGDIYRELVRLFNSMEHRYTHQYMFQEWHWSAGDNYINIVNDFGKIIIHINERIAGRFTIDTVRIPHGIIVEDGDVHIVGRFTIDSAGTPKCSHDVHIAVLEFIDKWEIGV